MPDCPEILPYIFLLLLLWEERCLVSTPNSSPFKTYGHKHKWRKHLQQIMESGRPKWFSLQWVISVKKSSLYQTSWGDKRINFDRNVQEIIFCLLFCFQFSWMFYRLCDYNKTMLRPNCLKLHLIGRPHSNFESSDLKFRGDGRIVNKTENGMNCVFFCLRYWIFGEFALYRFRIEHCSYHFR